MIIYRCRCGCKITERVFKTHTFGRCACGQEFTEFSSSCRSCAEYSSLCGELVDSMNISQRERLRSIREGLIE